MKRLAISVQKGGVGKTASTHALGDALAQKGRRVLMVDMDPQSSLTAACGVLAENESMAEVLEGGINIQDALYQLNDHLILAPADIALATTELNMYMQMGRENLLNDVLEPLDPYFDICLIDCPPSLGLLTVNALRAADSVLVPTQPQVSDLRGLRLFLQTIERVRSRLNPHLDMLGVLVTFYDSRLIHHQDAMETLATGGLPIIDVYIGRSVRVAEAAASGESIVTYEPSNKQAKNYLKLAEVIDQWLNDAPK